MCQTTQKSKTNPVIDMHRDAHLISQPTLPMQVIDHGQWMETVFMTNITCNNFIDNILLQDLAAKYRLYHLPS